MGILYSEREEVIYNELNALESKLDIMLKKIVRASEYGKHHNENNVEHNIHLAKFYSNVLLDLSKIKVEVNHFAIYSKMNNIKETEAIDHMMAKLA